MAKRDSAHIIAQRLGKVRDHFTCQICGRRDHLEGHHVIEYQYGGSANPDNIVTLCHSCHMKVHHGDLFLIRF